MTDRDCVLPKHGLEEQARVLFGELAKIGALEVLENGASILRNPALYSDTTGLSLEADCGKALFI